MYSNKHLRHTVPLIMISLSLFLTACARAAASNDESSDAYHKIDAETAKKMIGSQDIIIVDVRTQEEYNSGHLPDALLLPVETISDEMPESLPDQDAAMIVYCRTGRRSRQAADRLVSLGYTNVYDMGGIVDWPYDTVTG